MNISKIACERKKIGLYQNHRYNNRFNKKKSCASRKGEDIERPNDSLYHFSQQLRNATVVSSADAMINPRPGRFKGGTVKTLLTCLLFLSQIKRVNGNAPPSITDAEPPFLPEYPLPLPTSVSTPCPFTPVTTSYTPYATGRHTFLADRLQDASQFIRQYDLFTFPAAEATVDPLSSRIPLLEDNRVYRVDNDVLALEMFKAITGEEMPVDNGGHPLQPMILFLSHHKRDKRLTMTHSVWQQQEERGRYSKNNCYIRTKTNQGTVVGNTLLVGGEVVRNPFRTTIESFNALVWGKTDMSRTMELVTEGINVAADVVLGVFTAGAYPIIKYGSAKVLNAAGHISNQDSTCLKNEFSPEQLANLLLTTETSITKTGIQGSQIAPSVGTVQPKLTELENGRQFKPDGVFVQEDVESGINMIQYFKVSDNGKDYLIKEKKPGDYYAYNYDHEGKVTEEKKVYYNSHSDKIHFDSEMQKNLELDYEVVSGKSFIEINGKSFELSAGNRQDNPEILTKTERDENVYIPVYKDRLSKTWHSSVENQQPIFSQQQLTIIENLKLTDTEYYRFRAIENLNKNYYGEGKLYEGIHKNDKTGFAVTTVVEMHGELVPVSTIAIEKHGVGYEIRANDRVFPIAWDGERWIFEPATSPYLSESLSEFITSDMYAENIDASLLSAPDSIGLRQNSADDYFIKHNDRYLLLELDDKYHPFLVTEKYRFPLTLSGEGKFIHKYPVDNLINYEKMLSGANEDIYNSVFRTRNAAGRRRYYIHQDAGAEKEFTPVMWDAANNCFTGVNNDITPLPPKDQVMAYTIGPKMDAKPVTDEMRTATAKGLGIDLEFPLVFTPSEGGTPIPKKISSIWVGDKVIPDEIITGLQNNAITAKNAENPDNQFEFRLFLSHADKEAYQKNVANLRTRAPDVEIITLEDYADFYYAFERSKYFSQFKSAIEGDNGKRTTFASATDVLRYQLLFHEGGIYMDADDILINPPGNERFEITKDEIITSGVFNQKVLGMYEMFNNNIFGTHPHNPLLEKISEEAYKRYSKNPGLYKNKPDPDTQITAFQKYMKEISYISGPQVFNDVIDEALPELKKIKEMIKLEESVYLMPEEYRSENFEAFYNRYAGFHAICKTGAAHSWIITRR